MAKLARLVQTSRTNLSSGKGLAEQVLNQIQYQHPHKNNVIVSIIFQL